MERKELTQIELAYQKPRHFGQQRMQVVQDFNILGLEDFFFLCTLLRVLRQGINSSVCLTPTIVDLKVITRELLSLADLFKAQTLSNYKLVEVVVVIEYKNLMLRLF